MTTRTNTPNTERRLHLDKRAEAIVAATPEGDDDLLTSIQVASWLGVSPQWVELSRTKDYGPPFVRVAPQIVRYKRSAIVKWPKEREYKSCQQPRRRRDRCRASAT